MERKIEQLLKEYAMLEGCNRLLLACSGGADSSAMLDFFWRHAEEYGLTLYAAHFNHRLRGDESDRDENFVRELCQKRGIPFFTGSRDVAKAAARQKISIEMAAREARYAFLEQTAAELGARIATAHHAEDNLETMLLNLTRGTGLRGLCGIPPVREGIIRPLLTCTKDEILAYCKKNNVEYVTDSSNLSDLYSRNRIRAEVLPVLSQLNPRLSETAGRTSAWLREDEALLTEMAAALLRESAASGGLKAEPLRLAPVPVRRRALAAAIFAQTGIRPDSRILEQAEEILNGGRLQLAGKWFLICRKGLLRVVNLTLHSIPPVRISQGENRVGTKKITLTREIYTNTDKLHFKSSLSCDKIKGYLWAGSRLQGATFHPAGRGVGKSLKKLFWESGIPAELRETMIVLTDDEGVVWIEGFGADERCKPCEGEDCFTIKIVAAD